ncbi:MAG: ATP-binding cassette domain-containing protein [Rhodobacterales bacterium]|jgi:tungstate transport system ATP-binding protein|tara:strand:- start:3410 stop:4105 length:696 start_codon:yes stop_codon:yes gene_type:complete
MLPLTLTDVVVRRRGKRIIGPVTHRLEQGPPTIVIGPNGSGKTTLLRVIHGIERISTGQVNWTHDAPDQQAFVFQNPIVLRRTVAENLAYPLRLAGVDKAEIISRVTTWLARIGLDALANTAATRLSGGERQKLAIARALIRTPQVLFLDEPCANLDGHTTREIEALLSETAAAGTRLIMATHNMGQARRLAGDVIFMLNGKIHESGAANYIMNTPQTSELKSFFQGDIVT